MRDGLHNKITIVSIVVFTCVVVAAFLRLLALNEGAPIKILESGSFTLRGESVFFGEEKISHCPVEEWHNGNSYYIKRLNRTYTKEDDQYYIDKGHGKTAVSGATEEIEKIEEMFNRASEICNSNFSDLTFISKHSAEIPTLNGENVNCICLEYHQKKEDAPSLRLYLLNNSLYAIRSKDDDRFIFYVESLT